MAGSGSIATAAPGMTIRQSTGRSIIDWRVFSSGSANTMQSENGSGATLNRVNGGNLSSFSRKLSATGSVNLINPNGVVVGPGGRALTGCSLIASMPDVPNSKFMGGGTVTFSGTSNGATTNEGSIAARDGHVVLIGQSASNSAAISAPNGTAALAAGDEALLQPRNAPAGIYLVPDGSASNTGAVRAAAVALASACGNVYALAGNRDGVIQSTGTKSVAGQVWLAAPNGTVSATYADGTGGPIVADGEKTVLDPSARLSASSNTGGTVLVGIDPGGTNEAAAATIASGRTILATRTGAEGGPIETSGQFLSLGAAAIDTGAGGSGVTDPTDPTIGATAARTIDVSLNKGSDVTEGTTGGSASDLGDINGDADITRNSSATLMLSAFHTVNVDGNPNWPIWRAWHVRACPSQPLPSALDRCSMY